MDLHTVVDGGHLYAGNYLDMMVLLSEKPEQLVESLFWIGGRVLFQLSAYVIASATPFTVSWSVMAIAARFLSMVLAHL
ncbi:MAG: hypothetical protein ACLTDF_06570 [Coprococcus sp.]